MATTENRFLFNKNSLWPSYFILVAIAPGAFVVKSFYLVAGISALLFCWTLLRHSVVVTVSLSGNWLRMHMLILFASTLLAAVLTIILPELSTHWGIYWLVIALTSYGVLVWKWRNYSEEFCNKKGESNGSG
jgi:hypothetical protein